MSVIKCGSDNGSVSSSGCSSGNGSGWVGEEIMEVKGKFTFIFKSIIF